MGASDHPNKSDLVLFCCSGLYKQYDEYMKFGEGVFVLVQIIFCIQAHTDIQIHSCKKCQGLAGMFPRKQEQILVRNLQYSTVVPPLLETEITDLTCAKYGFCDHKGG